MEIQLDRLHLLSYVAYCKEGRKVEVFHIGKRQLEGGWLVLWDRLDGAYHAIRPEEVLASRYDGYYM
jgi:hypothetical protein